MSQVGRFREFLNRNIVAIVSIPTIVLLHWGWLKLQDVEVLIRPEEKRGLPIFEGAKLLETKIEEKLDSWKKAKEDAPK
ncbi:Hypothetical predicted protein [Cloeon dipterum]|uniref:Uncharacterized protein n=1 Tax=Cloeon dipterum TaxID=197152 RepID=A0A8S1D411_9INSE|nr:Hypothetical predicted protein [Cloeon dipterum]